MGEKRDVKINKEQTRRECQEFVSNRIAELRKEKNVSARKMSIELGKNINYISCIERKKFLPSIRMIIRICKYLKVTPKDFFDADEKL